MSAPAKAAATSSTRSEHQQTPELRHPPHAARKGWRRFRPFSTPLPPLTAADSTVYRFNAAIYGELVRAEVRPETRDAFVRIFGRLADQGAEAVIMGCTEIPLLMAGHEALSPLPLVDTARLHAIAAYEAAREA